MKTILAPIDFSPVSERVIAEAGRLARAMEGRVVLLHVTEPSAGVVDYAVVVMSVAGVDPARVKQAVARLGELEAELTRDGVTAESVHAIGSPAGEIAAQAQKHAADYIVLGSHGHTAFYELLMGSTAHAVLKAATCPVVVVPPPMAERKE